MKGHASDQLPLTLLYVEDETVTRDVVCTLLRRKFSDFRILTAGNGKEGLELFTEQQPDIVVTDIKMPAMSGIEMAARIKALKSTVPIIVTSAHSDIDYFIDAIALGIDRYVMKPIETEKLIAAIESCVAAIMKERLIVEQQVFIRKLTSAVEQSPNMVMITDPDGTIEYVNSKLTEFTGYPPRDLIGQPARLFQSGDTLEDAFGTSWEPLVDRKEWRGEQLNRKKDGEPYWESVSRSPIFDSEGIVTHFIMVKEDITARKKTESEIEILNTNLAARASELEVANKDLEAFGYTVSHDLRQPLTIISGYCQVISELCGSNLDKQCMEFIHSIHSSSIKMNRLIDTLLDFSRLTQKELVRGPVDLTEMARTIVMEHMVREPERRVTFTTAEELIDWGDGDLLRVALDNLLGNAWKYTGNKEEALIEFGRTEQDHKQAYYVRDNGAGFAMDEADKIFAAFHRMHDESEFKGIGIGLATVQRIIQRHGGRVWAEGDVGNGATFYFTLG